MEQQLYEPVHEEFRALCREFLPREAVPYHDKWEAEGIVDREVWRKAGAAGLLGHGRSRGVRRRGPEGLPVQRRAGRGDRRAGCSGLGFGLHNDVVAPYLTELATPAQRERWLPGFCSGDIVTAIAMSEPGAGSDLAGTRTIRGARRRQWVLNGQKTFITNGEMADLVVIVAKTAAARARTASASSRSRAARPASAAVAACRRSACGPTTPPSCSSTTAGCRPTTSSVRRTTASTT